MTEFEIFQDPSYFDMWCLRQKSDKEFAMTLHFPDRNQAVHAKAVILELLKREREACAAICDAEMEENAWESNASVVLNNVAAEIRARGEWTPDDTAYRPDGLSQEELPPVKSYCGGKPNYCEPEMPIDRGAWSDVPDVSKWVDELRGDDLGDSLNSTTNVVEPVVYVHLDEWLDDKLWPEDAFSKNPHEEMTPLYTAPPKREWQWLTEEDTHDLFMSNETVDDFGDFETIACAVSTKLKGKNNG